MVGPRGVVTMRAMMRASAMAPAEPHAAMNTRTVMGTVRMAVVLMVMMVRMPVHAMAVVTMQAAGVPMGVMMTVVAVEPMMAMVTTMPMTGIGCRHGQTSNAQDENPY